MTPTPRANASDDAGVDDWTCPWCGHQSPVPSLTAEHMARCVAAPVREVGAA